MNANVIGSTASNVTTASRGILAGQGKVDEERNLQVDLPPSQQVRAVSQADRVEISDVSKTLAALKEQNSGNEPEFQLSQEKLQEMAS